MRKTLFLIVCACFAGVALHAGETAHQRYVGGDISLLPQYEKHNSPYKDVKGNNICNFITWAVKDCGWNTFRVRLFVHPDASDPSVCQDLAYVTALGKRIKDAGAYFMLDFHYSDTWVDATHIQAPAAWKGASDAVMADSVAAYTRLVLNTLIEAGAAPDLVQVGNEIMYGLCGISVHPYEKAGDNWDGYLGLLKAGCGVVRELLPEAQIIIHTDRPTNSGYNRYYYKKLVDGGVEYDVTGLSYYPFWHGYLTDAQVATKTDKNNLVKAVKQLATDFPDKRVQIVECAYNFQYWPAEKTYNYDTRDVWTNTVQGQYDFVKDLVDNLKPLENVDGINYWFPEEAGNGDDTNWSSSKGSVIETWLNRGFWNEGATKTGHAINKIGSVSSTKTAEDVCAPYYLGTFVDQKEEGEGVENVQTNNTQSSKELRNGQLIIRWGNKQYNILGKEIK